jgi:excisionase family DNA binding protein
MSEVLTVKEVAVRLKIQPKTVREWLRLGKLPGVKVGKDWRVRVEDLEAVLQPKLRVVQGGTAREQQRFTRRYSTIVTGGLHGFLH